MTYLTILSIVFILAFAFNAIRGSDGGSGQTKKQSAREVMLNIILGYGVSFTANALILPAYGFTITASQNFQIGLFFTVISIVRGYMIRRLFNYLMVRDQEKLK